MNYRYIILTFFAFFAFQNIQAEFINQKTAEKVARNFYWERVNSIRPTDLQSIKTESVISISKDNKVVIYHVNFKNEGFVSVSADDAAYPILAYDFNNHIDKEISAVNYKDWINHRAEEISKIQESKTKATLTIKQEWTRLENNTQLQVFSGKSVSPLIHAKWNQDNLYNALSPADINGPGGHAYAGCVAVAMAQVMYYYRYPKSGTGSHSYYSNYGQLTANFGAADYDYNSMTNSMPNTGNYEVAELLYHCAVAVEMGFSATGSGAWPSKTVSSLKQYFGYQSTLALKSKSDYSDVQWATKIINNIDSLIPLFYAGYNSSWSSGHAFNLDGYQGSDFFHFNWGWGGAYNGYFYLNSLAPGTSDFGTGQQAIFDIYPANSSYPYGCNSSITTLTSNEGTLHDGSATKNYQANQDCRWLIQPSGNIDHIDFEFDEFELAQGDTLYFYDGANINAPILTKLAGGNLPADFSSNTSNVLIQLKTDGNNHAQGFALSYKAINTVFCSGITNLTLDSASFSDGSQSSNYNNGTLCRWYIKPTNGQPIKLVFTSFDTEAGKDIVKVYDPTYSPSKLLGIYSGSTIPSPVVSTSGEMIIIFKSNQDNPKSGWDAYYISGTSVGIDEIALNNSVSVYPNPTNNKLNIHFDIPMRNLSISIYSADGRLVNQIQKDQSNTLIDVNTSSFPEGYYIVKIQTDKGIFSRRFVVQR
jgi:hypothetical protein